MRNYAIWALVGLLAVHAPGVFPTSAPEEVQTPESIEDGDLASLLPDSLYGMMADMRSEGLSVPSDRPIDDLPPYQEEAERNAVILAAAVAGDIEASKSLFRDHHGMGVAIIEGPEPAIVTAGAAFGEDDSVEGIVTKRDVDGHTLFETRVGLGDESVLAEVHVDDEGNYVAFGGAILDWQTFDFRALIVKLDPEGNILWTRTPVVDGAIASAGMTGTIAPDGNLVVGGWALTTSWSFAGTAITLSPDGDVLMTTTFGDPGVNRWAFGVAVGDDGDIYLTGDSLVDGFHFFLTKLDPSGAVILDTYMGGERTWAYGLAFGEDDSLLVAGYRYYSDPDNPNLAPADAHVWSFDTDFDLLWETRVLAGWASAYTAIAVDDLGDIVVAGAAHTYEAQTHTHIQCTLVTKLAPDGSVRFHRCMRSDYIVDFGGAMAVATTADGGLIVTNGLLGDDMMLTTGPGWSTVGSAAGVVTELGQLI